MLHRRGIALVAVALAMVVPACGDDDTGDPAGEISVIAAWSRPSTAVQNAAAVYFMMTGGADGDALVGVSVDPGIAGAAELHETVPVDDAAHDAGDMTGHDMADATEHDMSDMGGAMMMRPVTAVHLDAGETVLFEPGGYHVMLLDLVAPLELGAEFELTLRFEQAGDIVVPVKVLEG